MTPHRGMDLRKAIEAARRIPGVRVFRNGRGDLTFECRALPRPRFSASAHRRDTAWGLAQFLKKAAAAAETR